jgi:hypothetical protein
VRTAVLLQRNPADHNGMFSATIKTSAKSSVVADGVVSVLKLVKLIPNDDPVFFDPTPVQGISHGAAVLNGSRDVAGQECPIKKDDLAGVDLSIFLAPDDDDTTAATQAENGEQPADAEPEEQEPGVPAEIQLEV